MIAILEKELKILKAKLNKAKRNLDDTGSDRHYNLVEKYESQIFDIEKLSTNGESAALKEFEFIDFITDIQSKLKNLRLDYPSQDGLLILSNYMECRVEKWIRS